VRRTPLFFGSEKCQQTRSAAVLLYNMYKEPPPPPPKKQKAPEKSSVSLSFPSAFA
jgi:hypothetical protein